MITFPQALELCDLLSDAAGNAISNLVDTSEAFETVYVGADGTDTKLIDDVSEKAILEVLRENGRSMRILSEEFGEIKLGEDPEFSIILDPLDGTYNVANGIPVYSISIAIGNPDHTSVYFGYVKNLANGDVFHAGLGKGAYFNGQRIAPSRNHALNTFCISLYGYRKNVERTVDLCKSVRRIRILGSVALELCYVASGRLDAFVDVRGSLRLVDVAAGKLVIEEAGGKVTDGKGSPLKLKGSVINPLYMVASNGYAHSDILNLIERH
ncbi:bifunctional fructose-bisphosphatase/inositol-phosphate phosphatase [Methanococcoides orientis]|uniref:bifunctional fructose-bisphosphatase/inositol-phosphate phosphatase n=1 Tax=Methanococcoides orientis TaxID=2822137 RepID=UPI001E5B364B|nr:bifunctional fructose-bisphosphatase/inositol-phosphate phosphatase [Methanococcoides orientis]UGV41239.1 bifunctional fructose-bisphosphatase/inositol-phosphate phosphatase [Methanococcoides orientis]